MIAPLRTTHARVSHQDRQRFERMLPAIRRQALRRLRRLDPTAREEMLAEVVALAYEMFVALARRGRTDSAYATPLATYACRQALGGRHLGTPLNVNDVTSAYCRRRKGVQVQRLDRFDRETGGWQEVLVEDRTANPADLAAMRIDFGEWIASLSRRQRRIAQALATGERTSRVARRFGVSAGRISQVRRELQQSWAVFQEPAAATSSC